MLYSHRWRQTDCFVNHTGIIKPSLFKEFKVIEKILIINRVQDTSYRLNRPIKYTSQSVSNSIIIAFYKSIKIRKKNFLSHDCKSLRDIYNVHFL